MNKLTKMPFARRGRLSLVTLGAIFLVIMTIAVTMLFFKKDVQTWLRSGETITAEFAANYGLDEHSTSVQVAGLEVGVVSGIEHTDKDTVLVSMKVEDHVLEDLGPKPSVTVAPATVLGGKYVVSLERGGGKGAFDGEVIPMARTRTPVELDRILEALPGPTRQSLQGVIARLERTLAEGGKDSLRDVVAHAPETLDPAAGMLEAAQGTRPGVDLPQLVTNLHSMANELTRYEGELGGVVTNLRGTTAALAEQRQPLAEGIESLPETLRASRTGLVDLRGTLDRLVVTADSFRPAARKLDPLLTRLDPVLQKALPLMRDLRPLMREARPMVDQLVPVAQRGTEVLNDLRGPVLERLNGPVTDVVMNTWRGRGPYRDSGGGMQAHHKFYEELGYLTAHMDRASMIQDAQGAFVGFNVGVNTSTLAGVPLTLPNLVDEMKKYAGGGR